jgi:AraC-like DNA-binding protein
MDILVDLERERTLLVGAMTRPLIVRREHASDLVGVRFRPGAARIFADVPADEMTDRTVDLDEIVGPAARPLGERMLHARGEAPATEALDAFLLPRLRRVHARERRLLAATRMLAERRGGVGIDALAGGVGVGRRQLERAFRAWVGLGPKATARVLRFQAARTRLLERSPGSLASIALSAGYHDQAHFTNEFRALAGETPRAFRLRRLGASQP